MADEPDLCCSTRQLRDLKTNFVTPQQFIEATCPSCWYNFRKNFCDLTCSPDQATFVKADSYVTGPGFEDFEGQEVEMIKSVTYFVNEVFVKDLYSSCKDIQVPALGGSIMVFLCGPWGENFCDPYRMFNFLGDLSNGYTPFAINYIYSNNTETEDDGHTYQNHNPPMVACDQKAPGEKEACGCQDCPAACSGDPPTFDKTEDWFYWSTESDLAHMMFALNPHFTIGDHDGLAIIMSGVFIIGSLFFLGFATNLFKWLGKSQHQFTVDVFTAWGTFAARHPLPVIFLSLGLVGSLCSGVAWLEVTTDPIELWASPTSRSRLEKDFFDSEFRPFYRTAIVIVKALHNPEFGMDTIPATSRTPEISHLFNKKFLKALLKLQKDIEAVQFSYTEPEGEPVTLDLSAVCFKPLDRAPGDMFGGEFVNGNCSINNIWAYWQDTEANLDVIGCTGGKNCTDADVDLNYLDHMMDCFNNPTTTQQGDTM
jgi:Niemann-Pick C1 protein